MDIIDETIWVANTLFQKGLAHGSSGNISFRSNDSVFVSKSGSCFGLMDKDSFVNVDKIDESTKVKPSKEYPMHLRLYSIKEETKSVIHTHSLYSTILSCVVDVDTILDDLMSYTPYLKMQCNGKIQVVDYAAPGSKELFSAFDKKVSCDTDVYILKNHGIFISSSTPLKAFYLLEEFEQTAKIYLTINRNLKFDKIA